MGWYRVDIDKYPELNVRDDGAPDQMVNGKGWRRMLGMVKQYDEKEKNEEFLAAIIRELTGDWYTQMPCGSIQHPKRKIIDEVIYFGPASDLEEGGEANTFT